MAYTKQTWQDLPSKTTPINASRLGHIEQGIYDAASTADTAASNASSALSGLDDKVDKVTGKGLSTNDFTDALQTKLSNIAEGAEVNVQSDWDEDDSSSDAFIQNKPTLGTSAYKNSTSVVTDSTDLVESGAVYDAIESAYQLVDDTVGWSGMNLLDKSKRLTYNATATDTSTGINISCTNKSSANAYLNFNNLGLNKQYKVSSNVDYTSGNGAIFVMGSNDGITYSTTIESIENITADGKKVLSFNTGTYPYIRISCFATRATAQDGNISFNELMLYDAIYIEPAYEPYHVSVEQTLRDAEVVHGKNLLNSRNTTLYNAQIVDYTDNEMSNIQADSKTALSFIVDLFNGSSYVEHLVSQTVISNTGVHEFSFTAKSTGTVIKFGHSGSSKDAKITYAYQGGFSAGNDYIISFNLISNHPDNVGGLVIDNIMIRKADITDSTYEPYYIPLKDVVSTKADNSVIGNVEDGTTASQAYAVGEHFIRDGAFCTCKQAISQGGSFTLNTNYTADTVADLCKFFTAGLSSEVGTISNASAYQAGNLVSYMFRFSPTNDIEAKTNIATGMKIPFSAYNCMAAAIFTDANYDTYRVVLAYTNGTAYFKVLDAILAGTNIRGTITYIAQ